MNSFVEYFGVAFLINLPERKDRLRSAARELARAGWTLGPGSVEPYPAKKFTDRAGFPSAAVRGCFHSHLECIRTAHISGKKSILLMEDDIVLASSIRQLTPSIVAQLDSMRWDFFYLGHEHTGEIARANSYTTEVNLISANVEIRTTHLFAINSRIFVNLLEHLDRIVTGTEGDQEFGPMPIDGAYNVFRRRNPDVRVLVANPKLGWQRPSRSDISPHPVDGISILRPLLGGVRNIKHAISRWRS